MEYQKQIRTIYHQIAKRGLGRKLLRTLLTERRDLAERNEQKPGFSEKFHHPRQERVNDSMPPTTWGQLLHAWRKSKNLVAKEAASKLEVPFDTFRGWESGKHTPQLMVRQEIERRMKL